MIFKGTGPYLNSQIYDDLNMLENAFPTLEWKGIESKKQLDKLLEHIFNPSHIEMIVKHLGTGLHDIRVFTEGLIHSKASKPDFYTHLDCFGKEWDMEYAKFLSKIAEVYTRPEVLFLLESSELDWALMDALKNFIKTDGQIMALGPIGEEIKQKSIIKAFFEVGLLYPEKHFSYVFSRPLYVKFFKRFLTEKLRKMTRLEKLEYKWWVLFKGLHIKDMNVNRSRELGSLYTDDKEDSNWDHDLYSRVGKRDDPSKEGMNFINKDTGRLYFDTYGKFTEFPIIKYNTTPLQVFLSKIVNFPHAWLHLPRQHEKEGNPEPALTANVFKWIRNKRAVCSELPQPGAEVRIGLHRDEQERALLKAAYIYDKPEKFRRPIKWRYVRRYAREVYNKKKV